MAVPVHALPIPDVRRLAWNAGLLEIKLDDTARLISFRTGGGAVRINVYYTTGTVGTCLEHPRMGKTQLFRRDVSLELLEKIFLNPRVHTELGYRRKAAKAGEAEGDWAYEEDEEEAATQEVEEETAAKELDEETAAKEQLARLKEEAKDLQREITEVQEIVAAFEAKREAAKVEEEEVQERKAKAARLAAEAERQAVLEQQRDERGRNFAWCGLRDSDFVKKTLCRSDTTCLAVGEDAALAIFEDGQYTYTSGLPTGLHNKLHSRPSHAPPPVYCAMGSMGRFYIKFKNGKSWGVVPDEFWQALDEKEGRQVKSVAFGKDWDTYFVVFTDGYWTWEGDPPSGLCQKLQDRDCASDLDFVSLGPNGEWFLAAKNRRMWWEGIDMSEYRKVVTSVVFGDHGAYLLRHT